MNFGVLYAALPKKILHLVSYKMLDFTPFLNLNWLVYDFGGLHWKLARQLFPNIFPHWCGRFHMLGGIFSIDVGDFTCLPGEREKWCPGGRLPLNAGELEALDLHELWKYLYKVYLSISPCIQIVKCVFWIW